MGRRNRRKKGRRNRSSRIRYTKKKFEKEDR